jgi:hypothetical protein
MILILSSFFDNNEWLGMLGISKPAYLLILQVTIAMMIQQYFKVFLSDRKRNI